MFEHILAWHGLGWLVWAIWWIFFAGGIKQGQTPQHAWARLVQVLLIFGGFVLLNQYDPSNNMLEQVLSLLLLVVGLAGMYRARRMLGAAWTAPAGLPDPQPLITCGLYRRIRHPFYSFFVVAFAGTALAHGWQALWIVVPVLVAFMWKARHEDAALRQIFGSTWSDYSNHTARMLPGIW